MLHETYLASDDRRMEVLANIVEQNGLEFGAEVGVYAGDTITYLLEKFPRLVMYGVDSWARKPGDSETGPREPEVITRRRTARFGDRCRLIKAPSVEGAVHILDGALDFVFIDAKHSYRAVCQDIVAWLPKVRKGGWLTGHDIDRPDTVARAVAELLPGYETLAHRVWSFRCY